MDSANCLSLDCYLHCSVMSLGAKVIIFRTGRSELLLYKLLPLPPHTLSVVSVSLLCPPIHPPTPHLFFWRLCCFQTQCAPEDDLELSERFFYSLCCLHIYSLCTTCTQCPWRPEEAQDPLALELTDDSGCWGLNLGPLRGTTGARSSWSLSSACNLELLTLWLPAPTCWITTPAFFFFFLTTEDQTWTFVYAGQELYTLSYILCPVLILKSFLCSACNVGTLNDLGGVFFSVYNPEASCRNKLEEYLEEVR